MEITSVKNKIKHWQTCHIKTVIVYLIYKIQNQTYMLDTIPSVKDILALPYFYSIKTYRKYFICNHLTFIHAMLYIFSVE